jgi:dipeptide/tripeptide permease
MSALTTLAPFLPAFSSMDGALEALCFFIQLGITGLGLVLGLVFFAVGRGVADEAKRPWNVALAVTGALVLLGWLGLLLLVVAL